MTEGNYFKPDSERRASAADDSSGGRPATASPPLRSWAEIDLSALRHNFRVATEGGRKVIAVGKADAYGHGAVNTAKALEGEASLLGFGVATFDEATELRSGGILAPLLILGTLLADAREEAVRNGFWVSVSDIGEAEAYDAIGAHLRQTVGMHVVIDTGMGRMGFPEHQFSEGIAARLAGLSHTDVLGLSSHFPSADEDAEFSKGQALRFENLVKVARAGGLEPEWIHMANSAGTLGLPEALRFTNAVRPGLMLYGTSPLPEHQHRLRPALTLKTKVVLVRELPPGHGISYGRTLITEKPTQVATLGIGYADGILRHLSGSGSEVLIRGKRRPLLGRITMDQIMVDVTGDKVEPGDEAVVIGVQGDSEITAQEVAEKAGTIPWEIYTSLSKRVRRIYRD